MLWRGFEFEAEAGIRRREADLCAPNDKREEVVEGDGSRWSGWHRFLEERWW